MNDCSFSFIYPLSIIVKIDSTPLHLLERAMSTRRCHFFLLPCFPHDCISMRLSGFKYHHYLHKKCIQIPHQIWIRYSLTLLKKKTKVVHMVHHYNPVLYLCKPTRLLKNKPNHYLRKASVLLWNVDFVDFIKEVCVRIQTKFWWFFCAPCTILKEIPGMQLSRASSKRARSFLYSFNRIPSTVVTSNPQLPSIILSYTDVNVQQQWYLQLAVEVSDQHRHIPY
jgi:hypothetical protein